MRQKMPRSYRRRSPLPSRERGVLSLDCQADCLDQLAVSRDLRFHVSSQLIGRPDSGIDALLPEPRDELGLAEAGDDLGVETLDHVPRCAARRNQAIPAVDPITGNAALREGWNLRRCRRAVAARNRKYPQLFFRA